MSFILSQSLCCSFFLISNWNNTISLWEANICVDCCLLFQCYHNTWPNVLLSIWTTFARWSQDLAFNVTQLSRCVRSDRFMELIDWHVMRGTQMQMSIVSWRNYVIQNSWSRIDELHLLRKAWQMPSFGRSIWYLEQLLEWCFDCNSLM